jgi:hypothetical protein
LTFTSRPALGRKNPNPSDHRWRCGSAPGIKLGPYGATYRSQTPWVYFYLRTVLT